MPPLERSGQRRTPVVRRQYATLGPIRGVSGVSSTHGVLQATLGRGCSFDAVSLSGPPPISTNPFVRVANDLRAELRAPASYPPGDALPSVRRTHRVITDPLGLLLDAYECHACATSPPA